MRFYRALLHLYPSSFRAEYGEELAAVFASRRRGARGFLAAVATWCLALADVVPNAVAVHADILMADLRQAARQLRRAPGFALTAVLVIALGVGANTAAFSVADFVLIRPLAFPHPDQLIKIWSATPGYGRIELSPGNYKDLKAGARSFSSMGAFVTNAVNLSSTTEPQRIATCDVTIEVLPLLGVKPMVGRAFTTTDTLTPSTTMLSYDLWQTRFGGDQAIIGKRLLLDGTPFTVIGIMPPDFHFPSRDVELWTPRGFATAEFEDRGDNYLQVIGRLAPNATLAQAQSELRLIAARLERDFPKSNAKTTVNVVKLSEEYSQRSRVLLLALCGAALCILLLACANLANLLLARAVARERELAVRAALGAGRERIVRQIITESALLAVLGGAAGVIVAINAVPMLSRLVPSTLPIAEQPTVDLRVMAFAAVLVLLTGLAFSVFPALRASSAKSGHALRNDARSGGGARQRVRSLLVAVEVAGSVVLLISSGLLVRAMWRIQATDTGFRVANVLTMRTALPSPKYDPPVVRDRYFADVLDGVRAIPGVQSAAFISGLPMSMRGGIWPVVMNGDEEVRNADNSASLRYATPQYFATLGIPIKQGRDIADTDTPDRTEVAVVSESFTKKYFPNEPALGKRFKIAFKERTIIGVVGDVRVRGLEQTSEPQIYLPSRQQDSASLIFYTPKDLVIHTTASPSSVLSATRAIVKRVDPMQPISDVQTMEQVVANETASRAAQLRVLWILAAIALLLSGIGIHGLLSFTVSRRAREIGVRVALGAQQGQVAGMVLREGIVLAILGTIPGVLIAYAGGRAMQSLLAGVTPSDPLTFVVAVVLCGGTTILGALRPARQAATVDPMTAIRAE
jgi:putative ABC transport system permease protein